LPQDTELKDSFCPNTATAICCNASTHCDSGLSPGTPNLMQQLDSYSEPSSYEEAVTQPEWQEAMKKESNALKAHNTWDSVTLLELQMGV